MPRARMLFEGVLLPGEREREKRGREGMLGSVTDVFLRTVVLDGLAVLGVRWCVADFRNNSPLTYNEGIL